MFSKILILFFKSIQYLETEEGKLDSSGQLFKKTQ